MSRHFKRDWEETVSGELSHCTLCPFRNCKDCPHQEVRHD